MRGWRVALARRFVGAGRGRPVGNYSPWLVEQARRPAGQASPRSQADAP